MAQEPNDKHERSASDEPTLDFRKVTFPSDALSIKRLRAVFPGQFDGPGTIGDGFLDCNFFFPSPGGSTPHLLKLTALLCDERIIAAGAFNRLYLDRFPNLLGAVDLETLADAEIRLEGLYQHFKLADGPEMARLLIEQIKSEGEQQAHAAQSRRK